MIVLLNSHCTYTVCKHLSAPQKSWSFDISYTKFHDLNSIHPPSVKNFVKHVVGWRIRKKRWICRIMAIAFTVAKEQCQGSRFQLCFTKSWHLLSYLWKLCETQVEPGSLRLPYGDSKNDDHDSPYPPIFRILQPMTCFTKSVTEK